MSILQVVPPPAALAWLHLEGPICSLTSEASGGASDVDLSGSPAPGASAGPTKASDWQILIVDDEPDIRKMLRLLLQDEGFRVSDAADGVIGLAYLRASAQPVIVLLDYKMPRMNGAELLEVVMADPQLANRHAFILVTANLPSFPPALHQLLTSAAIPVIQKPFRISVILDEIEHAIVRVQSSADPAPP